MTRGKHLLALVCLLLPAAALRVEAANGYPVIHQLTRADPLYRQISEDIASWYAYEKQGDGYLPPLSLYTYTPAEKETLFEIASRMNLPYETLAMLNGLEHPEQLENRNSIIIPNRPGLFIPEHPATELERIMAGWREVSGFPLLPVDTASGLRRFFFLPGERFHSIERAYFLGILFRLPLAEGVITSRFGSRISPISGRVHHHNGIDIAAPRGSEVFAARDGRVTDLGRDDTYGLYIQISHSDGYQTRYGHLDTLLVELNQSVFSGMLIGTVGSTGLSTGPHLHFEIRRQGEARDPYPLMPLF